MSASPRKNRVAFRPALNDILLEERVVLNATPRGALVSAGALGAARNTPYVLQAVHRSYLNQLQTSQRFFTQFANQQAAALYQTPENWGPDGRVTLGALENYGNSMAGGINATVFRLSSQIALLPESGRALTAIQNSFMGSQANSLASRITRLVSSPRASTSPWMLQRAVNRDINQTFRADTAALGNYFHTTPIARLSVDANTGRLIPITPYMAQRAVGQINNIFGALVNSVNGIAAQTIFDSEGNYNPAGRQQFEQLYVDALSTAAAQAGGVLSVFPNGDSLASQLQNAIFATGTNPETGLPDVSLLNSLIGALPQTPPTTPAAALITADASIPAPIGPSLQPVQGPLSLNQFQSTYQNQFTAAYENFTTPINNFFGLAQPTGLPSGFFQAGATFPNLYGSSFTGATFNNGFNNGFLSTGSGFPGYGIAPSNFPGAFGTGFNGLIGSMNGRFGFTAPSLFNAGVGGIGGVPSGSVGGIGGIRGGIGNIGGFGNVGGIRGGIGNIGGVGGVQGGLGNIGGFGNVGGIRGGFGNVGGLGGVQGGLGNIGGIRGGFGNVGGVGGIGNVGGVGGNVGGVGGIGNTGGLGGVGGNVGGVGGIGNVGGLGGVGF